MFMKVDYPKQKRESRIEAIIEHIMTKKYSKSNERQQPANLICS